jgi:hypothetical protein
MEKRVKLNTQKLLGFRLGSGDVAASRVGAKMGVKAGQVKKPR